MFYAIGISDRFTVLPAGLVLAVLIITGCGSDSKQEDIEVIEEPLALEISPVEVKALLDNQADFFLLDCREAEEFQTASIAGATLFPMSEIQQRVVELEPHRDRHVVVHCHLGGRSMQVTQWLRQQGFDRVQSMAGGIAAWSDQVDSSVPTY
tara:strand:+ start:1010 stop:1465 length:456 start_codon:yes stop_codon:yes gene_type:complete